MSTTTPSSLGHLPGERWEFDQSVTHVFDDMLARSIPQYPEMRRLVAALARHYVQRRTDVLDLGCSRGEALVPLIREFGAQAHFVGVDCSEPMLAAARERFKDWIESGVVDIRHGDLRETFPQVEASVILSVLTLMFTPINYRLRLIQQVYDHLVPGGAFLLVEKVLGATAAIDALQVAQYHAMKAEHGYSREEIERKRLALEGVQVPVTAAWNVEMLHAAGFRQVDGFWRWLNFAGWIAVK